MNWKFPHYDITTGPDWNAIEREYEWFRDMKDVPQDVIWHSEGDVQIHTKLVCEALINLDEFQDLSEQDKHLLFTSALFHDIEKRSTTCEEEKDGRICVVAPKHAKKGEYTARKLMYFDIPTPFHIREEICALVRYHGVPLWNDGSLEKKVVETSLKLRNNFLYMLSKADVLGRICPDADVQLEKLEFFKLMCEEMECFSTNRKFATELARYHYLSKDTFIDYVPFNENKFTVHMVSGIAGSGKDFFINSKLAFVPNSISLDDIRREMKISPTDSKGNGRVIQECQERVKVLMRKHQDFTFNATNITKDMRSKWISLFEEYGAEVKIYYIEVPFKKLLNQY